MSYDLSAAVGLNKDGSFCANNAADQQQVAELLLSIPLPFGGLQTSTGPALDLPTPFVDGAISAELVGAIQSFQTVQNNTLNIDLRVEPSSPTLALLVELAAQGAGDTSGSAVVVLDPIADAVEETAPSPVSGLPSLTYTPRTSEEQLLYDDGSVRVTATMSGILTGSWNTSIGPVCQVSPDINAMEQAVASGDARSIGSTALNQACSELRAQTRLAANGLFAAVSIAWDGVGNFRVGGSCGNQFVQYSLSFTLPDTITCTGALTISQGVPLTSLGATVNFSGTLALIVKVVLSGQDAQDEASLTANAVAILGAGVIVLGPLAAWIAEAATIEGARAIIQGAAAGLLSEHVLLGPSPTP